MRREEEEEEESKQSTDLFQVGPSGSKFSESILWSQMRKFYQAQGVEAWRKGIVPFFITTNQSIAKKYAAIIVSYLQDLAADRVSCENLLQEPVHIFELGSGSGKFSFLLLKSLSERIQLIYGDEEFERPPPFKIKYVMTDFSEAPFAFWKQHPALQKFFNSGLLDIAKLDACEDKHVTLQMSGKTISPCALKNPTIIVANYLFDSIPADAYRVANGKLEEGLITVFSKQQEKMHDDPAILNRFHAKYDWVPVDLQGERQVQQEILSWYESHFEKRDASFLLPTAAFQCLENIRNLSEKGQIMVLSGDKGISNTIAFQQGLENCDPHIAVHGSFSLMVNYHAIGLWFDALGGFALHCPLEDASLKVSAFVLHDTIQHQGRPVEKNHWNCFGDPHPHRVAAFRSMRIAFQENICAFGPDNFFQLQQHDFVRQQPSLRSDEDEGGTGEEWIRSVMALLQLSDWDPDLVFKFRDGILDSLQVCSVRQLDDLRRGMSRAWENYFVLEHDKDFAFEMGRFYYGLQEYEKALIFYTKSSEQAGKHHVTEHNIGLCHSSLGNKKQALTFFDSCLQLNPDYVKAREQLNILRRQLNLPPVKPAISVDLAKDGELVLSTKSPLNSPHVRVSFDPEVIHRTRSFSRES